jgi:hypothetical protein
VVDRFADVVERRPLLVRANTRDGGDGFSFERALDAILARPGGSGRSERFAASRAALERLDAARAAAMDRAGREAERADELGRLEAATHDLETALGLDEAAPPSPPSPAPMPEPGWRRAWRGFLRWGRALAGTRPDPTEPASATRDRDERGLDGPRALARFAMCSVTWTMRRTVGLLIWKLCWLVASGRRKPQRGRLTRLGRSGSGGRWRRAASKPFPNIPSPDGGWISP